MAIQNNSLKSLDMGNSLTSEEKRSGIYSHNQIFTNPANVSATTDLADLNLNWSERDLPEKLRTKHVHRLHPYLGKFIPQLVEVFLRKYFRPGETVLDPFCGSGTTLVQANELNINSVGCDISSFNTLLCRAKTAHYDISILRNEVADVLNKVKHQLGSDKKQSCLFNDTQVIKFHEPKIEANSYLQEWYSPRALNELLIFRNIVDLGDYRYKDLLRIILCRAARSARLTTHYELDWPKEPQRDPYWCYKHRRICTPTQEAWKFLVRYSGDTIKRIIEFSSLRSSAKVDIYNADSRDFSFYPVDGVITSPPYVGIIDYHAQHNYAYQLLSLKDKSHAEIGPAYGGSSRVAQLEYQENIITVFLNVVRAVKSGGRIIVVANDKYNLYGDIARRIGVEIEGVVRRHVNRRTGMRGSEYFESVFVWRVV